MSSASATPTERLSVDELAAWRKLQVVTAQLAGVLRQTISESSGWH